MHMRAPKIKIHSRGGHYHYILVAPCFKKSFNFKIRSWVPSPQMPYFKNKTQVTRTTHEPPHNRTHERNTRPNHLAAIRGCATTIF